MRLVNLFLCWLAAKTRRGGHLFQMDGREGDTACAHGCGTTYAEACRR